MIKRGVFVGFTAVLLGFSGADAADEPDCQLLVVHQPSDDVAFQPGVTARGDAVAPADLSSLGSELNLPERVTVAITVDLAARLGIPPGGDANFTGEAHVGVVEAARDGRVWFNGQLLTDPAAVALSAACQDVKRPAQ